MEINLIEVPKTASTNQYLFELMNQQELPEGTVVMAREQYAGKGQEGNKWESEAGKNLTFSLLLFPDFLDPVRQFQLNIITSLAVTDLLLGMKEITPPVYIKWPNDIYCGNRKAGGILMSNGIMGRSFSHVVTGIGLNINQEKFSPDCPDPVSIKQITGIQYDIKEVLFSLFKYLNTRYCQLKENNPVTEEDYRSRLYQAGLEFPYMLKGMNLNAVIRGVNDFGQLILDSAGGPELICNAKEIVYLKQAGSE